MVRLRVTIIVGFYCVITPTNVMQRGRERSDEDGMKNRCLIVAPRSTACTDCLLCHPFILRASRDCICGRERTWLTPRAIEPSMQRESLTKIMKSGLRISRFDATDFIMRGVPMCMLYRGGAVRKI
jgi:hypothetical protein